MFLKCSWNKVVSRNKLFGAFQARTQSACWSRQGAVLPLIQPTSLQQGTTRLHHAEAIQQVAFLCSWFAFPRSRVLASGEEHPEQTHNLAFFLLSCVFPGCSWVIPMRNTPEQPINIAWNVSTCDLWTVPVLFLRSRSCVPGSG